MKRIVFIATVTALALTLMAMPAFAGSHGSEHHGGGSYIGSTTRYSSAPRVAAVCSVEDCTLTGTHSHNGTAYYSHYYGDGHTYHEYCGTADCAIAGYHEHDGEYCFGHSANDGHGYHDREFHH